MNHLIVALLLLTLAAPSMAAVTVNPESAGQLRIVVDTTGAQGSNANTLRDAAALLADALERHLHTRPAVVEKDGDATGQHIIIARTDQYPSLVKDLDPTNPDAFAIVTRGSVVHVLGNAETGARHGVAALLHHLGFRFYNPSPRWWLTPPSADLVIDLNMTDAPALSGRSIWYAYGTSSATLEANYRTWAAANQLGSSAPMHSGHSYGNIIDRNAEAFAAHPEYYAMNVAGERENKRGSKSSKFCFSNPELLDLVAKDRLALLRERQKANPLEYMVSVDPSDGRGTCHCDNCKAIGTTTDRVLHVANHVARYLRQHDPKAWVGLYAYSSHRAPPTIAVEPNVYIQVALGFNRTPLTLPELVAAWGEKVGAVGLREYYGVEAWDWGLPGRLRGGQVSYHQQWIPYYAERKLNAINAETNANWGAQTPGGYVAAQLMWNPHIATEPMVEEFFTRTFGSAAPAMRQWYARANRAPQLEVAQLLPMYDDLARAYEQADSEEVRSRIVDLMSYQHYITLFRDFSLASDADPQHGDVYYDALRPLLNFAYRTAERDMTHYQALVRRLANGLPLSDGRFEYWMFLTDKRRPTAAQLEKFNLKDSDLPTSPVWMHGEAYDDAEIRKLFAQSRAALASDTRREVSYSRYLDYARAVGTDAGPSKSPGGDTGSVRLEGEVIAWIAAVDESTVPLRITPVEGSVKVVSYARGEDVLEQFEVSKAGIVTLSFQRANDYRVKITGKFDLATEADAPVVIEASAMQPATIRDSGPLYFYVPRGVDELVLRVKGEVTMHIPRHGQKVVKGTDGDVVVPVPANAAGTLWHVTSATDGTLALVNVPPLLHLHRQLVLSVREVSQSDGLTTMTPAEVEAGRWKE